MQYQAVKEQSAEDKHPQLAWNHYIQWPQKESSSFQSNKLECELTSFATVEEEKMELLSEWGVRRPTDINSVVSDRSEDLAKQLPRIISQPTVNEQALAWLLKAQAEMVRRQECGHAAKVKDDCQGAKDGSHT